MYHVYLLFGPEDHLEHRHIFGILHRRKRSHSCLTVEPGLMLRQLDSRVLVLISGKAVDPQEILAMSADNSDCHEYGI